MSRHFALLGGTTTWTDSLVAVRALLAPRSLIEGPAICEFEEAFAEKVEMDHAYTFWAGRVGLYATLRGLGIGAGHEVMVPVPTHIVVANAIRYTGARPIYVDCRATDYNMDLALAERLVTPRTKALVLQHTFGIPADLDAALALAARHGLDVIEDCVHSLGATYRGRPVGSFGRAAFFSTEETKIISSTMGGVVVTNDPALARWIRNFQAHCAWPSRGETVRMLVKLIAYHVLTQPYIHRYARFLYERLGRRNPLPRPTSRDEQRGGRPASYERRLSNAQARLALRQLRRLDENVAHRRRVAATYEARLSPHGFRLARTPEHAESAYVRYPVWVRDRAEAIASVRRRAVVGEWFKSVLSEAERPEHGGYQAGSCATAEAAARHLINLPTHLRVSPADAEAIADALVEASAPNEAGKQSPPRLESRPAGEAPGERGGPGAENVQRPPRGSQATEGWGAE
ncbi:MAG TPA: DegT/DnrJ/EryC1/StrS family aminotransferase [Thermoleophilaceae bacterium]|nr:DegT/DnrJ/EryC1/StrS family aminotransferase [Thermoleophilaceae bacterium]